MSALFGLLAIICSLVIHELGHWLYCRYRQITVEEFGVGVGPVLVEKVFSGTRFVLRPVPIAAYIKLREDVIYSQPLRSHLAMLVAGPVANIVCALIYWFTFLFILFWGVVGIAFVPAVEDTFAFTTSLISLVFASAQSNGDMLGPIGIMSTTAANGWIFNGLFAGAVCLAIGIVNLVPFPGLDGGQVVLRLFEEFRGRRVSVATKVNIARCAYGSFGILTVYVFAGDIARLIG